MRQHLVMHLALVADSLTAAGDWQGGRESFRLGEDLVDVIHKLMEAGTLLVSRMRQRYRKIVTDMARVAAEYDDAIRKKYRLFNVMGDDEDGLRGDGFLLP